MTTIQLQNYSKRDLQLGCIAISIDGFGNELPDRARSEVGNETSLYLLNWSYQEIEYVSQNVPPTQSRRHGGDLVGLALPNKAPSPNK